MRIARDTNSVLDITGPENTLVLLPAPGDEVTFCGGFIAASCARGRPPFVVILGDGAADGNAGLARECQRAARVAARALGLPDDRLLFVGLRQGQFPLGGTALFDALEVAMAQVSWRRDCNVLLALFAACDGGDDADTAAAWQLAQRLARAIGLPLRARFRAPPPWLGAEHLWRLDARQWDDRKAEAALAHGHHIRDAGDEIYGNVV
jgi:LmbE family N-acetylglucosaminyl deacetylase